MDLKCTAAAEAEATNRFIVKSMKIKQTETRVSGETWRTGGGDAPLAFSCTLRRNTSLRKWTLKTGLCLTSVRRPDVRAAERWYRPVTSQKRIQILVILDRINLDRNIFVIKWTVMSYCHIGYLWSCNMVIITKTILFTHKIMDYHLFPDSFTPSAGQNGYLTLINCTANNYGGFYSSLLSTGLPWTKYLYFRNK